MPAYDYTCGAGHVTELVRPIGTDFVACPRCGSDAERSHVHHTEIIGPTVNTLGMARRFTEAMSERDHAWATAEAKTGMPVPKPDDWASPKAKALAKLKHNELDVASIRKRTQGEVI